MNKQDFSRLDQNTQLWTLYEKIQSVGNFGSGCKTEWDKYVEHVPGIRKIIEENSNGHKEFRQSTIDPIKQVMTESRICHCGNNPGKWPHIMHTLDPIENFQSDCLIDLDERTIKILDLLKKLEKDSQNNNGGGSSKQIELILKYVKAIWVSENGNIEPHV